jgi:hypothetical protein
MLLGGDAVTALPIAVRYAQSDGRGRIQSSRSQMISVCPTAPFVPPRSFLPAGCRGTVLSEHLYLLAAQWPDPIRPRFAHWFKRPGKRNCHQSGQYYRCAPCLVRSGCLHLRGSSSQYERCLFLPAIGWWPDRATRVCISDPPRLRRPAGGVVSKISSMVTNVIRLSRRIIAPCRGAHALPAPINHAPCYLQCAWRAPASSYQDAVGQWEGSRKTVSCSCRPMRQRTLVAVWLEAQAIRETVLFAWRFLQQLYTVSSLNDGTGSHMSKFLTART